MPEGQQIIDAVMAKNRENAEVTQLELARNRLQERIAELQAELASKEALFRERIAQLQHDEKVAAAAAVGVEKKLERLQHSFAVLNEMAIDAHDDLDATRQSRNTAWREIEVLCRKIEQLKGQAAGFGDLGIKYEKIQRNLEERREELQEVERQIQQVEEQCHKVELRSQEMACRAQEGAQEADRRVEQGRVWERAVEVDLADRTIGLAAQEREVVSRLDQIRAREEAVEVREAELSQKWERFHQTLKSYEEKRIQLREREEKLSQDQIELGAARINVEAMHKESAELARLAEVRLTELELGQKGLAEAEEDLRIRRERLNVAGARFVERVKHLRQLAQTKGLEVDFSDLVL